MPLASAASARSRSRSCGPQCWPERCSAFLASFDETVVSFFISGVEHKGGHPENVRGHRIQYLPVIAAASTMFVAASIALMLLAGAARAAAKKRTAA